MYIVNIVTKVGPEKVEAWVQSPAPLVTGVTQVKLICKVVT